MWRSGGLLADTRVDDPHRPALIGNDRIITHLELPDAVQRLADTLPQATPRLLIHLPLATSLKSVLAYLAVLSAGHVALITRGGDDLPDGLLQRYRPNIAWRPEQGEFSPVTGGPQHLLHPELAVLLSTSGSTGSAKLVRLSHENVMSNADAIADALRITPSDVAVTTLPLHYSYGLSVLNSHLRRGAAVVVEETSVVDDAFWERMRAEQVTSMALVPHMVDLIDSAGGVPEDITSLRLVTQAGGRLAPDKVSRWAALGESRGFEFVPMYGQTEATARMTIMPSAGEALNPAAVGRPLANSSVRLKPLPPGMFTPPKGVRTPVGELIFAGPGVMLGYATHPDDLALGRLTGELHTGDIATIDDNGIVAILGRIGGFVKIAGLRVDLQQVEVTLGEAGWTTCVTGDDERLRVAIVRDDADEDMSDATMRQLIAGAAGLTPALIDIATLEELPRLPNQKVDRLACDQAVQDAADADATASFGLQRDWRARRRARSSHTVNLSTEEQTLQGLGRILDVPVVDRSRSFVALGGNSLSHVAASLLISRRHGALPRNWHHLPLSDLLRPRDGGRRRAGWASVEISVLLRVIAVVTIAGNHVGVIPWPGGAHTLLAVAGYNLARFSLSLSSLNERARSIARTVVGVAIPTMVVALIGTLITGRYTWSNVLMLNWLLGPHEPVQYRLFWFVDTWVASILAMAVLLSIPAVRRRYAAQPWLTAILITLAALIPRYIVILTSDGPIRGLPWVAFWFFTVGVAAFHARTWLQKTATLALLAVGIVDYFSNPGREIYVALAIAALLLVSSIPLPSFLLPGVQLVASASLYIYLLQFDVFRWFNTPIIEFSAAIVVGSAVWWIVHRLTRAFLRHQRPGSRFRGGTRWFGSWPRREPRSAEKCLPDPG